MSNHHPATPTRTPEPPAQPADQALLAFADQLAAAGLDTRSPAWEDRGYLKLINTPGAVSELTITTGGHLTWEYRPHQPGYGTPARLRHARPAGRHHRRPARSGRMPEPACRGVR